MFLIADTSLEDGDRFPRIRGDVPFLLKNPLLFLQFSPHTRGCSYLVEKVQRIQEVFPAYAGMFRARIESKAGPRGFPRIRGDVPRCCRW